MRKPFTTKIFFLEVILLNHCTHCPIQNKDALGY
ncbi:hypothetical protein M080_6989, partial [Bacteroides fragilis str. 3397 T10]